MSSNVILKCDSLSKMYGVVPAVRDISFTLKQHEFLSILGPSGCGKSTALRMIAGFEEPSGGTIHLNGQEVSRPGNVLPPQKRQIGMVFQDIALFPHLSIAENIVFGLNAPKAEKQARLQEMLELIGLKNIADKMPHMISGGEQQRVAIARALAPSPQMILLDEPFSSLDYQLRVQLRTQIRDILKKEKVSTILVTHDQEEAYIFSDRMLVFNQGQLIQEGKAAEIYHNPVNPWVASFVGDANFLSFQSVLPLMDSECANIEIIQKKPDAPGQLMFRPEDVTIKKANGVPANGTIHQIDFSGDQQILRILLSDGSPVQIRTSSRQSWEPEEAVTLRIDHSILFQSPQKH